MAHTFSDRDAGAMTPYTRHRSLHIFDKASGSYQLNVPLLKQVVTTLVSGVRDSQRRVVDEFTTEDVRLVHALGTVTGKDKFFYVYRCGTTFLDYELEFKDILSDATGTKACLWIDMHLHSRLTLLPRPRAVLPVVVLLKFAKDEHGATRIASQDDQHSVIFAWGYLGPLFLFLHRNVLQPVLGEMLVVSGALIDAMSQGTAVLSLKYWLKVLRSVLPSPVSQQL